MGNNDPQPSAFQKTIGAEITQNSTVHLNLSQDVIVTTEDKLRLCLQGHLERLIAKQGWIAPVSLFITLLIVFATSSFREFILPATTWQAIFVIGAIGTGIWALFAVVKTYGADTRIDTLVRQVKKTAEQLKGH